MIKSRVYSKLFLMSTSQRKYSILNWVLKLNLQKKNMCANISRFYCLYITKKTKCVSLSIYIFSRLIYKMKDEINSQIAFWQRLFTNATCCIKWLKNVKHKMSFGNSKRAKKIIGAYSAPKPPAVFYHSCFVLAHWETISA